MTLNAHPRTERSNPTTHSSGFAPLLQNFARRLIVVEIPPERLHLTNIVSGGPDARVVSCACATP